MSDNIRKNSNDKTDKKTSSLNSMKSTNSEHISKKAKNVDLSKMANHTSIDAKQDSNLKKNSISVETRFFESKENVKDNQQISQKVLGQGPSSIIVRCRHKSSEDFQACKIIAKNKITHVNNFLNEIRTIGRLDHPNIIKYNELFEDKKCYFLIMELCDTHSILERVNKSVTESIARDIFSQMVRTVSYCHTKNILFRELTIDHFISTSKRDQDLRLHDFGNLKNQRIDNSNIANAHTNLLQTAPEVLKGKQTNVADIWSLGVILQVMVSGFPPFTHESDAELKQIILQGKQDLESDKFQNLSMELKDLISKILLVDPDDRLTIQQILDHPWFTKDSKDLNQVIKFDKNQFSKQNNFNKFKKLLYAQIAMVSSEIELKEIKESFKRIDLNGDGVLSWTEINEVLRKQGTQKDEEIKEVFESMDIDGSGRIEYTEFLGAMIDINQYNFSNERIESTFNFLDRDSNGFVDRKELIKIVGCENEEVINWVLDIYDTDKDGKLSQAEFKEIMFSDTIL